jgi:hypothetical protein
MMVPFTTVSVGYTTATISKTKTVWVYIFYERRGEVGNIVIGWLLKTTNE